MRRTLRWLAGVGVAVVALAGSSADGASKRPRQAGRATAAPTARAKHLAAPHEGATASLDDARHLELVVDKKGLSLWLVDVRGGLLPVGGFAAVSARVAIKDKPERTVTLAPTGDHLRGDLDLETALQLEVVVSISESGKAARQVSLRWGLLNRKDVYFPDNPLDGLQL